jgi:hypothetical protein
LFGRVSLTAGLPAEFSAGLLCERSWPLALASARKIVKASDVIMRFIMYLPMSD